MKLLIKLKERFGKQEKQQEQIELMTSEQYFQEMEKLGGRVHGSSQKWYASLTEEEKARIIRTMNEVCCGDISKQQINPQYIHMDKFPVNNLVDLRYNVDPEGADRYIEMTAKGFLLAADNSKIGKTAKELDIVVVKSNGEQFLYKGVDVCGDGDYMDFALSFCGYHVRGINRKLLTHYCKGAYPTDTTYTELKEQKFISAEEVVQRLRYKNILEMYEYELENYKANKVQRTADKNLKQLKDMMSTTDCEQ